MFSKITSAGENAIAFLPALEKILFSVWIALNLTAEIQIHLGFLKYQWYNIFVSVKGMLLIYC